MPEILTYARHVLTFHGHSRFDTLRIWFPHLILITLAVGVGVLSSRVFGHEVAPQTHSPANPQETITAARGAGLNAIKYSTDFEWSATPVDDLGAPGAKTVHLPRCPSGVTGSESEYWVYINGTGTPEALKVTGGTCKGDERPGTLTLTTNKGHPHGYVLTSASGGLQEASIAARVALTFPEALQGGKVVAPPGEFRIHARVSLRTINQTVDFTGSVFECWVDDACIYVGDPKNSNLVTNVTLINPRGRPTVRHGHKPMLEVNGQKTRIFNLMTRVGVYLDGGDYGKFGSYVNVVGDQAFLLDGLDTTAGFGLECTASFCGTVIKAPGPFSANAAVGWLKHLQIAPVCQGNGIDWQSGNTLRVSDSVIQGYSQFGLRGGLASGGYGMISMENVYMEDGGSCTNPLGKVGTAGVIVQGGKISIRDGEAPSGHFPTFANTGKTEYRYYLIAHNKLYGASNPLYAGNALSNGSGNITVTTPDLPGAATFDLLRVAVPTSALFAAPNGTGNYAVATGVARASACTGGVCTFTDTQTALGTYTVPAIGFFPRLDYWPGPLVLGPTWDGTSVLSAATASLDVNDLNGVPIWQVNVLGSTGPAISMTKCSLLRGSPVWASCLGAVAPRDSSYWQMATLMGFRSNTAVSSTVGLKGRLIFNAYGDGSNHIITLVDSNFNKTVATENFRPPFDVNDAYIGYDAGGASLSNLGISVGAPASISNYIGNVGDGKSWKERLTQKQKTFAVPVAIQSGSTLTVGSGTPLSQMKIYKTTGVASSSVPGQSCIDVKATVPGLSDLDQITGLRPPKPLGNLSVNGYASAADTVTLHFCNPTPSSVGIPPGTYSFLAMH